MVFQKVLVQQTLEAPVEKVVSDCIDEYVAEHGVEASISFVREYSDEAVQTHIDRQARCWRLTHQKSPLLLVVKTEDLNRKSLQDLLETGAQHGLNCILYS